jgi:aryl-alcohol dehydrogenase
LYQVVPAVAAVLNEKAGRFSLEPVTVGPIADDEVLVEIVASGLCHTDLAIRDQRRPVPLPAVVGHEGAGIVRATGGAVRSVAAGQPVVLTYMSCGRCPECDSGHTANCRLLGSLCFASKRPDGSHAVRGHDGKLLSDRFFGQSSFATWAVASERNVVGVPSDIPLEILAPLGCGLMTGAGAVWNDLGLPPGASFAVFGAGSVGLSAVMAARVSKAAVIVAVDRVVSRLEVARELGATHTVDASECGDTAAVIRAALGDGVKYALDTTGNQDVIRTACRSLCQRGTLAIAATGSPTQLLVLPQLEFMTRCLRVIGVVEGGGSAPGMIQKMIGHYREGMFPFDRLITTYEFAQINDAVYDCESGTTIKAVLKMPLSRSSDELTKR